MVELIGKASQILCRGHQLLFPMSLSYIIILSGYDNFLCGTAMNQWIDKEKINAMNQNIMETQKPRVSTQLKG